MMNRKPRIFQSIIVPGLAPIGAAWCVGWMGASRCLDSGVPVPRSFFFNAKQLLTRCNTKGKSFPVSNCLNLQTKWRKKFISFALWQCRIPADSADFVNGSCNCSVLCALNGGIDTGIRMGIDFIFLWRRAT